LLGGEREQDETHENEKIKGRGLGTKIPWGTKKQGGKKGPRGIGEIVRLDKGKGEAVRVKGGKPLTG